MVRHEEKKKELGYFEILVIDEGSRLLRLLSSGNQLNI